MFKYNELSDLIDGSLVTPLSKEDNGTILCLDSTGSKVYYSFDDFDFDKTINERKTTVNKTDNSDSGSKDDSSTAKEESSDSSSSTITTKDVIEVMEKDIDDSTIDGTDEEFISEDDDSSDEDDEKEGFITSSSERDSILELGGITKKTGYSYRIWKDII